MRSVFLSMAVLAAGFGGRAVASARDPDDSSPSDRVSTNLPPWRANSCLVAVRGVIWNDPIGDNEYCDISLVVKNVSTKDVYALKRFNSNNYILSSKACSVGWHNDAAPANFDKDCVRLKPGEVMVFSAPFALEDRGEGKWQVIFHNNIPNEDKVAPTHNGIPVVNHVEYDFDKICVYHNIPLKPRQPIPTETTSTPPAAGSHR